MVLRMTDGQIKPLHDKPVHVLHVASGDLWAGAEAQVFYLARAQHGAGRCSVRVALFNDGELARRLKQAGVPVCVLDEARLSGLALLFRLRALIRTEKITLVHTHRMKENVLGGWAARLCPGVMSVRTVHGADEFRATRLPPHKRLYRLLDRWTGRLLQRRIVAVSHDLGERLMHTFPAGKVRVVENGIDVEAVQAAAQKKVRLPVPETVLKVAFAGRLVPVKRVDLFLEVAAAVAKKEGDACHFYLFGDGPGEGLARRRIEELGIGGITHMLGHRDDLPACLARMDLLLITSDHEGLPMVLLEALCLQVPVVAHGVGGIPAVLEGVGTVLPDQRVGGFADAVRERLHEPERFMNRARMGAEAVAGRYRSETVAARYLDLYAEAAGGA